MTDDIKAIRDALQAGPTPGPWHAVNRAAYWHEEEGDVRTTDLEDVVGAEFVAPIGNVETTRGQVWLRDAQYIAACHPDRIARLLDALELAQKDAERWRGLYRRAVNEANGLTNYVDDRPELRRAERNLTAIEAEARAIVVAMKGQA